MSKNILIVDDSKPTRLSISIPLKQRGYSCSEASNPRQAMDLIKNNKKFDLIITDLHMPEISGIELIQEIRKNPEYKSSPVIIMSVESLEEIKKEAKKVGVKAWMTKPVKPDQVPAVVEKVLKGA